MDLDVDCIYLHILARRNFSNPRLDIDFVWSDLHLIRTVAIDEVLWKNDQEAILNTFAVGNIFLVKRFTGDFSWGNVGLVPTGQARTISFPNRRSVALSEVNAEYRCAPNCIGCDHLCEHWQ